jgi:hypothetical protein
MMTCDCDNDDATGDDRIAEIGSNGARGGTGDVDAINGEDTLLRFIDVGTEVGAGTGAAGIG